MLFLGLELIAFSRKLPSPSSPGVPLYFLPAVLQCNQCHHFIWPCDPFLLGVSLKLYHLARLGNYILLCLCETQLLPGQDGSDIEIPFIVTIHKASHFHFQVSTIYENKWQKYHLCFQNLSISSSRVIAWGRMLHEPSLNYEEDKHGSIVQRNPKKGGDA